MNQLDKIYSHNIDLIKNSLKNAKLNPISKTDRLLLILTTADEGYTCWDENEKSLYTWTGVNWKKASADNYIDIDKYIVREKPSGVINGINNIFTLSNTPIPSKEMVFINGLLMDAGNINDYILINDTIIFQNGAIPCIGDKILTTYLTL